jgi:hypothetical protein
MRTTTNKSACAAVYGLARCCLAVGLLTLTSHVFANPKLFEQAKSLIAQMKASQAYMLLIAEQDKLAGQPDFDYLLGVAALDSGKTDEAIIAFERVLAAQPNNAGAQLDLARAYFNVGSLDLAEGTFRKLREQNPPASALNAIDKYLGAIAQRRKAARKMVSVWGETALGYDSNLTGVPNDFTTAVQQAFNLIGVLPTGNSVKRKAPYLGAGLGVDYVFPVSEKWTGYVGADARGRGYRNESPFNSGSGEVRASAIWDGGKHSLRFNTSYNAFVQSGDAPGDPKPTNDRRAALLGSEYRFNVSNTQQLSFGVAGAQTRFPKNNFEDFKSSIASTSWLLSMPSARPTLLQLTAYGTRDKADRKLPDGITDKSKKVVGVRGYVQKQFSDRFNVFGALGGSERRDDSPFARSTTVERGEDRLADASLGVNWRFQPQCNMRAQIFSSRNNSNIAIYDYTRHEVSSTIRCEFM